MKRTSSWRPRRSIESLLFSVMAMAALAIASTSAQAQAPGKDKLEVTAHDSYGEYAVPVTSPGNAPNQWFYLVELTNDYSLDQTFPIDFHLADVNGLSAAINVSFNPVGSLMDAGATVEGADAFGISDGGTESKYIHVTAAGLQEGTYSLNIQISATPSSKVQLSHNTIHILVVVTGNCASLTSFLTDNEFTTIVTETVVNVNQGRRDPEPKVVSTNPFGQLSYNVLFVNGCGSDETVSFGIALDSRFETNPKNNPGNAVFTYLIGETVAPDEFDIQAFGAGNGAGQNLWFSDVTVPAGHSFLITVHIQIIKGQGLSSLPLTSVEPPSGIFDGFSAQLYAPGTTIQSASLGTGILAPLVRPNPSESDLPFTVQ